MVKIICFVVCLSAALSALGQDTTFYDQNKQKVSTLAEANTYYVLQLDQGDTNRATNRGYYRSGAPMSEEHLIDTLGKILRDGKYREYYENGKLRTEADYTLDQFDGQVLTYWPDGKSKRSDVFREGNFVKGTCYDAQGKPVPHFDYYRLPKFPGGEDALGMYIRKHIKYPKNERTNGVEGEEVVQFTIEVDGSISNVRMIQTTSQAFSDEVIRMVHNMPKWEPGAIDGEPAVVDYSLPVNFTLK